MPTSPSTNFHPTLRLILATLLSALATPLSGQQTQTTDPASSKTPDISVNVKLVTALVTVRDHHDHFVQNLTKDDFTIEEDGRPQSIKYFSQETEVPLTLGLLVDTSLSQRRVLGQERSASQSFIEQLLREDKDTAFLIHFDHEVELLQDLTSSRQKLTAALGLLESPRPELARAGGASGTGSDPRQRGGSGGGTLLYDAIFLACDELMSKQQGRKSVIVLSDGVDHGSKILLESAIQAAQRADTVVYSILFKGEESHSGWDEHRHHGGMGRHGGGRLPQESRESRPDGKKILERISKETGGRLFEVSKKETLEKIYASIQEELRNQYSLAYTPQTSGMGYHKIRVTTRQKDLKIQTRDGYYAGQ
jgi:VWFA-related protein